MDSLNKIAAENPEFIGKYYAKIAKTDEDGITALNKFLAQDGLLIYVPKNVKVERTIQVINILRSDVDSMVNRRVLIVMEQGAEAKFCLLYTSGVGIMVSINQRLDAETINMVAEEFGFKTCLLYTSGRV